MEPTNEQRIYALARGIWSLVLRGDQTQRDEALFQRMRHPQPGDLVVELSTGRQVRRNTEHAAQAVGFLVAVEGESYQRRYHVRPYAGGEVLSWDNAEFVAVPNGEDINQFLDGETT
jgi:hypothetical protein